MIATKKVLPRRTVLRGVGTALALPLLSTAWCRRSPPWPERLPRRRSGWASCTCPTASSRGTEVGTPASDDAGFAYSRIMKPLEPERDRVTVFTGLDNRAAFAYAGEALGSHSRPAAAFLTGMHAKH